MLTMTVGAAWQRAQRRDDRARSARWSPLFARDSATAGQWGQALACEHERSCQWAESLPLDLQAGFSWERASALGLLSAGGWSDVPVRDLAARLGWNRSIAPREIRLALVYNPMPGRIDVNASLRARRVNEQGPRHDPATALQASLYVPGSGALAFAFGGQPYFPGTQPYVFFDFRYAPVTPAIQPTDLPASAVDGRTPVG